MSQLDISEGQDVVMMMQLDVIKDYTEDKSIVMMYILGII